jgi:undecaprenyl-diphosphatase
MSAPISPIQAAVLGFVQGLTEFLPVSSTGHLIVATELMGLGEPDAGVDAFLVVIQVGSLLAVLGRYRANVVSMLRGLAGRDAAGLRLAGLLLLGFAPVIPAALLLADPIKAYLFSPAPVALALALGGAAMIAIDRRVRAREAATLNAPQGVEGAAANFAALTWRAALIIGLAQCLALWPGTSRSMVTILAGLLVGLTPRAAAEFSFLLALPTLGAATVHDSIRHGPEILEASGWTGIGLGFVLSCIVAALAMKYFVRVVVTRGLAPFGWYRIAIAFVIFVVW